MNLISEKMNIISKHMRKSTELLTIENPDFLKQNTAKKAKKSSIKYQKILVFEEMDRVLFH